MDTLSLILDEMHLQGGVFVHVELSAPWAIGLHTPGLASFHFVARGQAWLIREAAEPLFLKQGDIVILPSGAAHVLRDKVNSTAAIHDLLPGLTEKPGQTVQLLGGGSRTNIMSGHAHFDTLMALPLIASLPPIIHIQGDGEQPPIWMRLGLQFFAQEISNVRPAQQTVLNRLGDLLLIECLRHYVEDIPLNTTNWLTAVRDKSLSVALGWIHKEPQKDWTVQELAKLANLSRSTFAGRFTQAVGLSPLAYLTQHRMRLAARQLKRTSLPINRIAHSIGYASEAAFSQAFKREYGTSPSAYRDTAQSSAGIERR